MASEYDLESESASKIMYINICRICLESGEIPIFGGAKKPDLSPEITSFGAIQVCQYDEMPQHICNSCYALLQNAILFRDMAKKSEIAIKYQKKLIEEENLTIDEEKSKNGCNIQEHVSDHNYSKSEAVILEKQSCSGDSESGSTKYIKTTKNKQEIECKTDILLSKTGKKNEIQNTATCCKICNIKFETPSDYYEHDLTTTHIYNVKNLGRIECDICKTKMNRSYYLRHLLYHSFGPSPVGGNMHKCRICNKLLLSEAGIKIHRHSEMHKTAVKSVSEIECPVCHTTVKRNDLKPHLSRHASEVANRVKQKCPICSKVMAYSYYTTHLRRKHSIELANESMEAFPTLQVAEKKSKTSLNGQKKSTKEENVTFDKEDSNKEKQDTEQNCFKQELQDTQIIEPPSSDDDYGLENVNIPIIEESRNETSDNSDSNMDIFVVFDMEDTEHNKEEITDNSQIVNPVHTCQICNLNFQTSDDYYEHIGTSEHMNIVKRSPKIECIICKKTINKSYYLSHIKYHCFKPIPTNGVYTCKICDEILPTASDARTHINSESHKISERAACEIECPLCHNIVEIVFLTNHLQQHASEAFCKQKCPLCSKYIGFKHYATHLRVKHNVDKIKEVVDYDIDYRDNTTSTETKVKSYVCDICGKVCHKAGVFRAHCLTHGGEMRHKCEFCPYQTITKSLLTTHLKTHLGIYNFRCDKCPGRKFLSKSNLTKHVKTHRGPIDFECETCHKGFYNKGDLKRHVEVVHLGIRNYVCHICNSTFAYRKALRKHLTDVHNFAKMRSGRQPNYMKAELSENNK